MAGRRLNLNELQLFIINIQSKQTTIWSLLSLQQAFHERATPIYLNEEIISIIINLALGLIERFNCLVCVAIVDILLTWGISMGRGDSMVSHGEIFIDSYNNMDRHWLIYRHSLLSVTER